jgi:succinate dehydrogenase/fumarate reductase flavoprotein subunit
MAEKKVNKMKVDIVIIGGGGAGLPAALTAHERGMSALVLEKRGVVGGNALLAEGFFAAESPAQKRLLIDAKKDDLFKTALNYAHYKGRPENFEGFYKQIRRYRAVDRRKRYKNQPHSSLLSQSGPLDLAHR